MLHLLKLSLLCGLMQAALCQVQFPDCDDAFDLIRNEGQGVIFSNAQGTSVILLKECVYTTGSVQSFIRVYYCPGAILLQTNEVIPQVLTASNFTADGDGIVDLKAAEEQLGGTISCAIVRDAVPPSLPPASPPPSSVSCSDIKDPKEEFEYKDDATTRARLCKITCFKESSGTTLNGNRIVTVVGTDTVFQCCEGYSAVAQGFVSRFSRLRAGIYICQ